jgi:hypothetical protein
VEVCVWSANGTFRQPPKKRVHHESGSNNIILRKSFNEIRHIFLDVCDSYGVWIMRIIPVDTAIYSRFCSSQRKAEFSHLFRRFAESQNNGIFLKGLRILRQAFS